MKKVISYSLWGKSSKYTIGALRNAETAKEFYPGWICRFHVASDVPYLIKEKLLEYDNVELIERAEPCNWTGMFWRFEDASDPNVDVMISRDTDSRLNMREKLAVDEWLSGDKGFHIMRDHPYHATEILGGMWGAKKGTVPNMKDMIQEYVKGDFWQVDQNFLKEEIYPLVRNNSCVHDDYFEKKPFPIKREPGNFVGQAFNADDSLCNPEHARLL
jgi:protein O-GlcNAc transferase